MRLLKVLIIPESTAQSPSKRRRNASNVWTYIDKTTRKCKVEKCSVKFGEKTCRCKRRYDDIEIPNISILENGYPQYRRQKNINISKRNELDLRVVSHNREIVMDWYGHANLEFVGAANVILYLYKYLFKGAKNKKMEIVSKNKDNVVKKFPDFLSFSLSRPLS